MFWNPKILDKFSAHLVKLTVNMKCFEILFKEIETKYPHELTVNMKCFEIQNIV